MSTPRHFNRIDDAVSALRAWGFIVLRKNSGHYQVLQDRSGFGPNKVIAVLPSHAEKGMSRIMDNALARVRRETGIDVRQDPPRRVGNLTPTDRVEQAIARSISGIGTPIRDIPPAVTPPPERSGPQEAPAPVTLDGVRRVVRQELQAVLGRLAGAVSALYGPPAEPPAAALQGPTEPKPPAPAPGSGVSVVSAPAAPCEQKQADPPPAPVETPVGRKRRVTLTAEERLQAYRLRQAGDSVVSIAKRFNVSDSGMSMILKAERRKEEL